MLNLDIDNFEDLTKNDDIFWMAYLVSYSWMLYTDTDWVQKWFPQQCDAGYISEKIFNWLRKLWLQWVDELEERIWYDVSARILADQYYMKIAHWVTVHEWEILDEYL